MVMLLAGMALAACKPPNYPTKPIELKYYATGPWAVTVAIGAECCAAGVRPCEQGPTRLATLVTWLDVDARAAAAHLERLRPHPRGLWVRPCLYCDVPMVVNDEAGDRIQRLCERHAHRTA